MDGYRVRLSIVPLPKCSQMAIHYSQTLVDYLYLSQKDAAGFVMLTSRSFVLKPNHYSQVRLSACSSLEVTISAVCATLDVSRLHSLNGTTPCWRQKGWAFLCIIGVWVLVQGSCSVEPPPLMKMILMIGKDPLKHQRYPLSSLPY